MKKAVVGAVIAAVVVVLAVEFAKWRKSADENNPTSKQLSTVPIDLDKFVASKPALRAKLHEPPPAHAPKRRASERARLAAQAPEAPAATGLARRAETTDEPPVHVDAKLAPSTVQSIVDHANELLAKGEKWEARKLLSKAFFVAGKALAGPIRAKLDDLNKTLIFSPEPTPGSVIHVVKRGDVLLRIAKKYGTTAGLIMRVNHKASDRIMVGERLKILTGKVKVVVDKSDLTLTLLLDSIYVKQYPICIGRDDRTPVGEFVIDVKQRKPVWYSPGGKVYRYGDPKNQLGTRWLGFKDKPGCSGFGIHGTTDASSVPGRKSMGCVRMHNADVEEVYDFVTVGSPVEIRE